MFGLIEDYLSSFEVHCWKRRVLVDLMGSLLRKKSIRRPVRFTAWGRKVLVDH